MYDEPGLNTKRSSKMAGFPEISVASATAPAGPNNFISTSKKAVSTEELVAELEEGLLQPGRDRTRHPFVEAVYAGKATLEQIGAWRHQVNHMAYPINKMFGYMWSRCPDADLAAGIIENMMEEEHGASSGTKGHIELNNTFLDHLGWPEERRNRVGATKATLALRHWLELVITNRPFAECLAAVSFTAERHNPPVNQKILDGLKKHYKLPEEAITTIHVHASHVEEEHGMLGPVAFSRYATTPYAQDRIRATVYHTAELYYDVYDVWEDYK